MWCKSKTTYNYKHTNRVIIIKNIVYDFPIKNQFNYIYMCRPFHKLINKY